jgi:hypothetical protein
MIPVDTTLSGATFRGSLLKTLPPPAKHRKTAKIPAKQ